MSKIKNWIKASRLPSQSYIFFPLLVGQSFYYNFSRSLDVKLFVIVQMFGIFIQLYIVYANDYADYEIDRTNDTYNIFSGGSRVLVEGLISKIQMKRAIILTVVLNILLGIIITGFFGRVFSLPLIIVSMLLLWGYSYPPLKLSYRGGGELLQTAGVAMILPIFGYYVQSGSFQMFPWIFFISFVPIQLGCAMSTSLPDYPSDRLGNKRTSTVIFGFEKTKSYIIMINFFSLLIFTFVSLWELNLSKIFMVIFIPAVCNIMLINIKKKAVISSTYLDKFVALNILVVISFTAGNSLLSFLN